MEQQKNGNWKGGSRRKRLSTKKGLMELKPVVVSSDCESDADK